jgi:hypothetical protein
MQDRANELLRIPLLSTWVNKAKWKGQAPSLEARPLFPLLAYEP